MTLNINPGSLSSVPASQQDYGVQPSKTTASEAQSARLPQDSVSISSFGDLVSAALNQPEVRADKVSAIREAVQSGTYKIDPHAIASAMLADQL